MKIVNRIDLTAVFLFLFCITGVAFGQGTPNVPLLAQINQYPSVGYNDCWGYTDPGGREYALLGVQDGTSIIDITDTDNPVEIAFISSYNSLWKDIKTYMHYAYVVNESGGGMQIIDLSDLPNSATLVSTYSALNSSHNIYIDEPNAMLYAEGSNTDPVIAISLADPLNPVEVSTFGVECHDVYVQDNVAYISEGSRGSFGLYDVSTPASPVFLKRINVPSAGYAHNAWASEDGNYLMTTEETYGKTVKLWDISNIDNINLTDEILAPNGMAHNTHIKGDYAYISHYDSGLRIIDISDPNAIFEAGYYVTAVDWGAYPFFATGKILISDMNNGLYVVYFQGAVDADSLDPNPVEDVLSYSDYSTPNSVSLQWINPTTLAGGDSIPDFSVIIMRDDVVIGSADGGAEFFLDEGLIDGQYYDYSLFVKITESDSTSTVRRTNVICGGSPIPSTPIDFTGEQNDSSVTLSWVNPTTQIDGTPLDDISVIRVYRNGEYLVDIAMTSSDTGQSATYTDTPPFGYNHDYQISVVDNETIINESELTNIVMFWIGITPDFLIWNPEGAGNQTAYALSRSFYRLGLSAAVEGELDRFGNDLYETGYKAIFVLCGFSPNSYQIWDGSWGTQTDLFNLRYYLNDGGGIYMEAGDEFSNYNASTLTDQFDIDVAYQWGDDLDNIVGIENTFTDGMNFDYTGANEGIDWLTPTGEAFPVFLNSSPSYFTAIANIGESYRTIGSSFEFGGLVDYDLVTKEDLLTGILDFLVDTTIVSVDDSPVPLTFALEQNYPNPFNPVTTLSFSLPEKMNVELAVYNLLGKETEVLVKGELGLGEHKIQWNAQDVPSGVYIYRLKTNDRTISRKMLLLK